MQTTMNLLEQAITTIPIAELTRKLGLSRQALYTAKDRGHLSPAIAGAIAEEMGQDSKDWIVIAALESERDSACKDRMLKRWKNIKNLYLPTLNRKAAHPRKVRAARIAHAKHCATRHAVPDAPNFREFLNRVIAR